MSTELDVGGELSEMLVGKDLTKTDAIGAQLTLEYLVGGDFELGIDRTSPRTRNRLERGVSLK